MGEDYLYPVDVMFGLTKKSDDRYEAILGIILKENIGVFSLSM
jgi:hypothetical protein